MDPESEREGREVLLNLANLNNSSDSSAHLHAAPPTLGTISGADRNLKLVPFELKIHRMETRFPTRTGGGGGGSPVQKCW